MRKTKFGWYANQHSCFLLQYHLVLITKYRHPVIAGELKEFLYDYIYKLAKKFDISIIELNGEADHIHILFEAPVTTNLANMINSLKTASSRQVRSHFADELRPYYWKPYFWSRSYFICTVSERSTEVVRRYIQNQGNE